MDQSSSGNLPNGNTSGSKNGFSRSRRNRSRRKKHHSQNQSQTQAQAENRQQKKQKTKPQQEKKSQREAYMLPGFSLQREIQKPQGKPVGSEFFSDLKATPNQPLREDGNVEHLTCCYCHEPIREMSLAIDVPDFTEPAHFDCVLSRLKDQENLQPKEEIIYMGNRKFAVVVYKTQNTFDVIREIPFEDNRDFKSWRNEFSVRMRKQLE